MGEIEVREEDSHVVGVEDLSEGDAEHDQASVVVLLQ